MCQPLLLLEAVVLTRVVRVWAAGALWCSPNQLRLWTGLKAVPRVSAPFRPVSLFQKLGWGGAFGLVDVAMAMPGLAILTVPDEPAVPCMPAKESPAEGAL